MTEFNFFETKGLITILQWDKKKTKKTWHPFHLCTSNKTSATVPLLSKEKNYWTQDILRTI